MKQQQVRFFLGIIATCWAVTFVWFVSNLPPDNTLTVSVNIMVMLGIMVYWGIGVVIFMVGLLNWNEDKKGDE